jgi:hypothetical protein
MELQAGRNVRIHDNTFTGGVVSVKLLSEYPFSKYGFRDISIYHNTATGFREEGLSTDARANQANTTVREVDEISSASGNTVVLQESGWSGSTYGDGSHYMSFYTGSCRGVPYKITAQSGRSFTLESLTCTPSAGDLAVVGIPFIDIHLDHNTADASCGLRAVDFWGYSYNSTVIGNKVAGPTTQNTRTRKLSASSHLRDSPTLAALYRTHAARWLLLMASR